MLCEGRDIGPDEVRLGTDARSWHRVAAELGGDVEEDSAFSDVMSQESFRIATLPCRVPYREILDESCSAVGERYHRTASSSRQVHNGTDYYRSEENRLSTFRDWRYQRIVRREDLARNGFFYTGTADKVRCLFCNVALHHWSPADVVEHEHRRAAPDCPFLQGREVGNVPLTSPPTQCHREVVSESRPSAQEAPASRHQVSSSVAGACNAGYDTQRSERVGSSLLKDPGMALEENRLAMFKSWPPQLNQKPEQLARCGLYYTGDGDKVKCFSCDVILHDWDPADDPFKEHARWSPNCQHLHQLREEERAADEAQGCQQVEEEEQMESPAVQAVLFSGVSRERVRQALEMLRKRKVVGDKVTAEVLMTMVMELEQPVTGTASQPSTGNVTEAEFHQLQQENESLREKQQCKICMERDVEVIFYPCKHFVCCESCGSEVSMCPICRQAIQHRDKVFMA